MEFNGDTPDSGVVTHQSAWLVEALRRTEKIAALIGVDADKTRFLAATEELALAIDQHLWSEEDQAFIDCIHADGTRSEVISQQTNTVIYLCQAASAKRLELIAKYAKEVPEGWVQVGSPFMLFFVFEALAKQGEYQRILDLTREGWGLMLEHGSTTCWEMFPGYQEGLWSRSLFHAWSAGPAYFLSRYQYGVQPLASGFAKVLIAPELGDLDWCKGRVPTPHGEVEVAWKRKNSEFSLNVELPKGVSGDVRLPISPAAYELDYSCGELKQEDALWQLSLPEGASLRVVARKLQ